MTNDNQLLNFLHYMYFVNHTTDGIREFLTTDNTANPVVHRETKEKLRHDSRMKRHPHPISLDFFDEGDRRRTGR